MNTTFELTLETTSKTTLDFNNVVKMESQYQLEDGDAYILYFKDESTLFISNDDSDDWLYQTDKQFELQHGDKVTPQVDKYNEIVDYIKSKSEHTFLEDKVVDGVHIINIANEVWTVNP